MSKPKFIKPLLIGCACAIPVGLIVGLSVNWDHRQFISSVGSSGVKPFIEAFGNEYIKENPKIDVQVESGGTTFAIEQIAKGLTNVGNASNNPYYTINPTDGRAGYKDQWVNKKTLTLGYEGLVIMYKMPNNLSTEAQENFDIVISRDNILHLFAVFSGFAEDGDGTPWTAEQAQERASMFHYMTDEAKSHLNASDEKICRESQITVVTRSGGNTAANSSIAFSYYSQLADFEEMSEHQQQAFKDGQYGTYCGFHHQSEESNARAWEMFRNLNVPSSMVYLTTGFVKNKANQKAIIDAGYKLAGYKPFVQGSDPDPVHLEKDGDLDKICSLPQTIGTEAYGYNWYRPINCMIDLDNQLAKDFIAWIYTNSKYVQIVENNGAKPLTLQQFASMTHNGELFVKEASDIELLKHRAYPYDEVYGAEDIWE